MMPLLVITKRLILLNLQLLVQVVLVVTIITTCKFGIVDSYLHTLANQ